MSRARFESYIADLLEHPDIQKLQLTNAHWHRNRLEHNYMVGLTAYRLATWFQANVNVAARAGFLHDWYHGHAPDRERFVNADQHHFRISHKAAAEYGEHPRILHAIRTHFWPWGRVMPKTREAWIVWMADNLVWLDDIWHSLKLTIRNGWKAFLYGPQT